MRALVAALTLISCTAGSAAQSDPAEARYSGTASLAEPIGKSTDQRFEIRAQLQPKRPPSSGRFALDAHLLPDAKAAGASCNIALQIFSDGFEAP